MAPPHPGSLGATTKPKARPRCFKVNEDGSGFRKLHDNNEFQLGVQLVSGAEWSDSQPQVPGSNKAGKYLEDKLGTKHTARRHRSGLRVFC